MKQKEKSHKGVSLFLFLSPLSSVFNALSSVSSLLLAVLLSSHSQSLLDSEDYDGEENNVARERRQTTDHRKQTRDDRRQTTDNRRQLTGDRRQIIDDAKVTDS